MERERCGTVKGRAARERESREKVGALRKCCGDVGVVIEIEAFDHSVG